jgi:uncharacterized protein (TIGR03000 family)
MFRRTFAFGGVLLVAAALVFVTPGLSQAQRGGHGGGFHGGGFHGGGGGFRAGGVHVGGYHGGGYRGGYHAGGYHPYYRGYHSGVYGYYGGYPYYGGYYGGYPYYGGYYGSNYGSYPYYSGYYPAYGYYPYYSSGLSSDSVYDPGYSGVTLGSDQFPSLSTSPAPASTGAQVTVTVPRGAEVWFDDMPTTSTGPVREFHSPSLTPGNRYTYTVRARWMVNGREVTQTQRIGVTAGGHVDVRFPAPSGTGESGQR